MTEADLQVMVLFDSRRAASLKAERDAVGRVCAERSWSRTELVASQVTAGSGRRVSMVKRQDAANLYVACHRRPTAVIAFGSLFVRSDPRWSRLRDDRVIPVQAFCRYKAKVLRPEPSGQLPTRWADSIAAWTEVEHCRDHRDPRCFPLYTFDVGRSEFSLEEEADRSRFDATFGAHPQRIDNRRRQWNSALRGQRHGRDPVSICGTALVEGFHWDVSPAFARTELVKPDAVFEVLPAGYVNVYPDGALRNGKRSARIWSPEQSAELDAKDAR